MKIWVFSGLFLIYGFLSADVTSLMNERDELERQLKECSREELLAYAQAIEPKCNQCNQSQLATMQAKMHELELQNTLQKIQKMLEEEKRKKQPYLVVSGTAKTTIGAALVFGFVFASCGAGLKCMMDKGWFGQGV